MRATGKKVMGTIRLVSAGVAVIAQLILLAVLVLNLKQYTVYPYLILQTLGFALALILVDLNANSSYTVTWLVIILMMPVFGLLLYALWGRTGTKTKRSRKTQAVLKNGYKWLVKHEHTFERLTQAHPDRRRIAEYLGKEGFPLYAGTTSRYYALGEHHLEAMMQDMEKAKDFIFLEYFILDEGEIWDRIHGIIRRKAAEGVEVRLLYDDFGSIIKAPEHLVRTLMEEGIRVIPFNPVNRLITRFYINFRNHQKITVVDGHIGYTGGANLADEYANLYPKLGHWKDTGIRLEGEAVWGLTVTFLQMWESETGKTEDYSRYKSTLKVTGDGFYQPFTDGPVNNPHNPAETMYRQIISNAKEYVYITTPYLVINDFMIDVLCIAAKSGIDVRIVTPKVWDRWYVHMVTRSNYGKLMASGVRIYEYTPGYIHAKTILSDDDNAIVGSINMDYRSFNLHFENGVWICGSPVLKDIRRDIEETLMICEEISLQAWQRRPLTVKLLQGVLRLFGPLL